MVEIRFDNKFKIIFSKIRDEVLRIKIKKQIRKIANNPGIGKPMRYHRKSSRELYLNPYRLSYLYNPKENTVFILDYYHKKKQ